jgi:hypothetical protein
MEFCLSTKKDDIRRADEERKTALMALGLISGTFLDKKPTLSLNNF